MAHPTQDKSHAAHKAHGHEFVQGVTHEAVVHDPEHDIDAVWATVWVAGGAVVFFISMWLLFPIFLRVQDEEHNRKVATVPTTELNAAVKAEREFLHGQNPTKKTIDQVMQQMAGK